MRRSVHWRELATYVAVAFLIRISFLALRGDYLDWDEALYLLIARNVLEGNGLTVNGLPHIALSPLVPLASALTSGVSGLSLLTAQRLLIALAGALIVIPVWYLIRINSGGRIAGLGALLIVGWTALIDVGPRFGPMWRHSYAGSEPLYLTALFSAFALGELGLRQRGAARLASLLAAGGVLGLAYLTRPEAIVVGGLYALFRGIPLLRQGGTQKASVALGVTAIAFLVVAGPYLLHMRQLGDSWTLSGKLGPTKATGALYEEVARDDGKMLPYLEAWWALDEDHNKLANPYWGLDGTESLRLRLSEYRAVLDAKWTPDPSGAQRAVGRVRDYGLALWALSLPLFAPFVLVGFISRRSDLGGRFPPFVLAGFTASLLTSWQVFVLPRFFLYLVPAFALWAARGVIPATGLPGLRRVRDPERVIVFLLLATGIGLAAMRTVSHEAGVVRDVGRKDRIAGERLAEVIASSDAVMSWHPRLAYWGGWEWRTLPVASLDAVVHYAANRQIDYLLLVRGAYSPLALEADYVIISLDPAVANAYREIGTSGNRHLHPPATLLPVADVAGFPAGLIVPASGEESGGD